MRYLSFLASLLFMMTAWTTELNAATPSWSGSGTVGDPYLIQTDKDWTDFFAALNMSYFFSEDYSGCHFRLESDVNTSEPFCYVDAPDKAFSGTFDGNGHTVTVNIESNEPSTALFRIVNGATIRNLHVAGTVTTSKKFAAGIVGTVLGSTTIENCRVSVKIISNVVGDGTHGGFVGINKENNGTLTITGCLFDGQLLGANTSNWGGFVGWNETNNQMKANLTDCLFAPKKVSMKGGYTFFRTRNGETLSVTLNNCYYTQAFAVAQGKFAYSVTAGEGTTVALAGTPKLYDLSGITVFSGTQGYQYASVIYGGNEDALLLNINSTVTGNYTTTAGSLTGNGNPYTLTMESADAVIATLPSGNYQVKTESELRAAMQIADSHIDVLNDIRLSNSTLEVSGNRTITIDLGGHTLDRALEARGKGGGQVFTVRKGATLYLSNGTITGGWGGDSGGINNEGGTANLTDVIITGCTGDDRGGGICNRSGGTLTMTGGSITNNISYDHTTPEGGGGLFNAEGATATLTGVTITGNEAKVKGGGGICNYGTLTLDGCTIQHNTCRMSGGGIWNKGTLNMQGAVTVTENSGHGGLNNNVFLKTDNVINVTGQLTGNKIGISMESMGVFTTNYNTHHSGTPISDIFSADLSEIRFVTRADNNEAEMRSTLSANDIYYVERSWDEVNKKVVGTIKILHNGEYDVLNNSESTMTLGSKPVVVKYDIHFDATIEFGIFDNEITKVILCDGATMKMEGTFHADSHHASINFYGQEYDSGKLDMSEGHFIGPRIGNHAKNTEGIVNFHGGTFDIVGGQYNPAIGAYTGSETHSNPGDINIYGGNIKAVGGPGGAAIGSGGKNTTYGTINIYGGNLDLEGGPASFLAWRGGAAIGGGCIVKDGTINIYGGIINAKGGQEAAGIGCGEGMGSGIDEDVGPGTINISGGIIVARGDSYAAGIGYGDGVAGKLIVNISGGHVEAYGGTDAAGIGGGEDGPGGIVSITGGYVYAEGNDNGAGIGGGEDGKGGRIEILGGTVIAKAGRNETGSRAFGPGRGSDVYGQLDLGNTQMVSSERIFTVDERRNGCWYRTQARVEPCKHASTYYTVNGTSSNDTHTLNCNYCRYTHTEKHTIVNGVCTVCGASATTYPLRLYLPKDQGSGTYDDQTYTRTNTTYQLAPNTTYTLPACQTKVPGLVFKGWEVSSEYIDPYKSAYTTTTGGDIMQPGENYVVNDGVSFIARYQPLDITLADNNSNSFTLLQYAGMTANSVIIHGRTLKKNGQWNTLCLPFNFSAEQLATSTLAGCTLMELDTEAGSYAHITGFDETTGTLYLNFKTATSIEAGKPYLIKWENGEDIQNPVFSNVTINNVLYGVTSKDKTLSFSGIYSPKVIEKEDKSILYLGSNNTLYYPSQVMTIGSCRAHFRLKGIEASPTPLQGGENGMKTFVLNFGDDATDILECTTDHQEMKDDAWFTLDGVRLHGKPTTKGVYINNGRKIVIK